MHTTSKMFIDQRHDGIAPASWNSGDTFFQKAKFIAAMAWSVVKDPKDPELPNCDMTHQENLIGEVESIMSGSAPNTNSRFAVKAAELINTIPPEDLRK